MDVLSVSKLKVWLKSIFNTINSFRDRTTLLELKLNASNDVGAAAKEPTELFIKNTALC